MSLASNTTLPALYRFYTLADLQASYATSLMASVSYGIYLVLSVVIFRLCFDAHRQGKLESAKKLTLCFTLGMLAVTTGWYVAASTYNAPILGGGLIYQTPSQLRHELSQCQPKAVTRDVFKTLQILGADGLLIWRSYVIWNRDWRIIVLPAIAWFGILGSGITWELVCLQTKQLNFSDNLDVFISQTVFSVFLNIVTTGLIAGRLLWQRGRVKTANGTVVAHIQIYSFLSTIFIESVAIYTIANVVYLGVLLANSPLITPFAFLARVMCFLGPAFIQLRVAEGKAYSAVKTGSPIHASRSEGLIVSVQRDIEFSPMPRPGRHLNADKPDERGMSFMDWSSTDS